MGGDIESQMDNVSGVSPKGESMRGVSPSHIGKIWDIVVPEKCQVSNLILKASLAYFMQYFASILAYTGAVADIQRKRKAMISI